MFINFALYSGVCIYVKTSVFLVRNNGEKERGHLELTYMGLCVGMCEFWYVKVIESIGNLSPLFSC